MDPRRPPRPPSWGGEPPSHVPSSVTSPYQPHPLQRGPPQRETSSNPSNYSPRHQRHTSQQETRNRQEWPPAPSSTYPLPPAPAGTGYEKRRNSYGSTMPPHQAPDFDRGSSLATSPPAHSSRRDPHYETARAPQSHQPPPLSYPQVPRGGERTIIGGSPPVPYRGMLTHYGTRSSAHLPAH